LEDTYSATADIDIVAGISYDEFQITKAQEFDGTNLFEYPKGGSNAFNWQAAMIWRYSPMSQLHASISSRTRFAGIWELYSTRFGTAIPNPNLGPERGTNYELGWQSRLLGNTKTSAAIFYSDVSQLIQTVQVAAGPPPMTQTQNVGNGEFYGFEAAFDTEVSPEFSFGGNYTYIERNVEDALQPNLQVTGVPRHKALLYATWRPIEAFTLTPSIEIAGSRWSDVSTSPAQIFPYIRTGAYTLVNAQAQYEIVENSELAAGVRNLLDDSYELSWGFPQAGRSYYFKVRAFLG
jgi:iron complex outermembrane receptor protein